jgi:hypothetical protein
MILSIASLILAPAFVTGQTQSFSGVYRSEYPVMATDGQGLIKVKLTLANNGVAKLGLFLEGVSKVSDEDVQQYGTVLKELLRDNSVQQTGTWKMDRGLALAKFTTFYAVGRTTRASTMMEFRKQGEDLKTSDYTRAFYGRKFSMSLERSLGEVADSDKEAGSNTNPQSYGNGTLKFGNGDRTEINDVDFRMNKNKYFSIRMSGASTVEISGSYLKRSYDYQLTIRELWVKGRKMAGRGAGLVKMNANGKVVQKFTFSVQVNTPIKSASMVFTPTNR